MGATLALLIKQDCCAESFQSQCDGGALSMQRSRYTRIDTHSALASRRAREHSDAARIVHVARTVRTAARADSLDSSRRRRKVSFSDPLVCGDAHSRTDGSLRVPQSHICARSCRHAFAQRCREAGIASPRADMSPRTRFEECAERFLQHSRESRRKLSS